MPLNTKAFLAYIIAITLGASACKKDKEPVKTDDSKLFKVYNYSGETLNFKLYRNNQDYIKDNPTINTRFDNNQFIYLDPAEFDGSKYYTMDYYNDALDFSNWGVGTYNGQDNSVYTKITAGNTFIIYKRSKCNARSILLKNNKSSFWKAVDAFSAYNGSRVWDTLSADKKNYVLECNRHSLVLSRIKGPQDTVTTIYDPLFNSIFSTPPQGTIFNGQLGTISGTTQAFIYNYTKPYLGDPKNFDIPGATGTQDTIMIFVPDFTNYYMMVRQQ